VERMFAKRSSDAITSVWLDKLQMSTQIDNQNLHGGESGQPAVTTRRSGFLRHPVSSW
jgi:hypothetical protein